MAKKTAYDVVLEVSDMVSTALDSLLEQTDRARPLVVDLTNKKALRQVVKQLNKAATTLAKVAA